MPRHSQKNRNKHIEVQTRVPFAELLCKPRAEQVHLIMHIHIESRTSSLDYAEAQPKEPRQTYRSTNKSAVCGTFVQAESRTSSLDYGEAQPKEPRQTYRSTNKSAVCGTFVQAESRTSSLDYAEAQPKEPRI